MDTHDRHAASSLRSPRPGPGVRRRAGFSVIEILIGMAIGLIAVLLIYHVFAASEGLKRNTVAAGDAQTTGILATFLLAQELGNAGAGMAGAAADLATCADTGDGGSTMRPIPVLITDGGADDRSDTLVVNYGVSRRLVTPAPVVVDAPAGADFTVQSPTGFRKNDLVVVIDGAGTCATAVVTADPGVPDVDGIVTITHTTLGKSFVAGARLVNFGPVDKVQRVLYDVNASTLRGRALRDPATGAPDGSQPTNPIASNIALMKVQYGIDTDGDGALDTWSRGSAADGADPAAILASSLLALNRILAVRVGLIVRSEQPVNKFDANGHFDVEWQTQEAEGGYRWTLFDCLDAASCPGRLTGTISKFNGSYHRYRVYERIIPLRNQPWNQR
jgi:type IV pilus assembly protein PilW